MKIIHTPTKELYRKVVQSLLDNGSKWYDGERSIQRHRWNDNKDSTCIRHNNMTINSTNKSFYEKEYPNFDIEDAEEFLRTKEGACTITTDNSTYPYPMFGSWGTIYASSGENKHKKSKIMKLNNYMKKVLSKELRTLIQAGFVNGDLELTTEGKDAIWAELLDEKKTVMVKLAEEKLKEEKENRGTCDC